MAHCVSFQNNLELTLGIFILCHLIGMSSAAINPILYGYLNESFRKEFKEIFAMMSAPFAKKAAAAAAANHAIEDGPGIELDPCPSTQKLMAPAAASHSNSVAVIAAANTTTTKLVPRRDANP